MEFVKTLLEEQKELLTEELRFAEDLEYAETKQRLKEVTDALNKLFICDVVGQSEQLKPNPQICYKSNEPCEYDCSGLCRESY